MDIVIIEIYDTDDNFKNIKEQNNDKLRIKFNNVTFQVDDYLHNNLTNH